MKLDDLNRTQDSFSYKSSEYHRFSNSKYIVAVKDEDFPDRNLIPLFYYEDGKVFGIDTYDMAKILTSPNNRMPDWTPFAQRFSLTQLVKISYGDIKPNNNWHEGSNYPKCWTFHTNVHPIENNEVLEVFEGEIDESKGRIKINNRYFHALITELYIDESTAFYIESESKLVGPFKALRKDSEGYFIVEKHNWKSFGEYENNENSYYVTTVNNVERKLIVPSSNEVSLISERNFLTDNEILEEFKEKLNKSDFDNNEINSILNYIKEAIEINSIKEYVENNNRIKSILEKTETTLASDYKLLEFLPQVGQIKKDIDELETDKFNLEQDKIKLQNIKEQLDIDIEESKDYLEKLQEQIDNSVNAKDEALKNVNSELEGQVNKLQEQKEELKKEINCIYKNEELQKLEGAIDYQRKQLSKVEEQEKELKSVLEQLKKENLEAQKEGQKQLMELLKQKKHFDFLSGRDLADYERQEKTNYQQKEYCSNPIHNDYLSFRALVLDKLAKLGRKYDTHFVDNLLISLHQNTLTVFAGLPGTGKTSLARMLIKILTPSERSTEVSVHRGWTSQKDLIGFQNPLNNKFHPSSTGMYELLSQINIETQQGDFNDLPLAYVLLDEANLSPLEHYWSTFYNLTDSIARENSLLKLNLGDSTQISYPNNIRFIATINSDQTTEPLSPRILDRVNMIQIPQQLQFESNIEFACEEIEHLKLAYCKSIEYFNLLDFKEDNLNVTISPKVEKLIQIYAEIKKRFKDLQIFISPRIDIAVKKYFIVASTVMREDTRPLDYCISQRILPLINVQGDKSKSKLEELQEVFEKYNLSASAEILNKILQRGEDDSFFEGTYNYFLTFSYAQGL